MITAHLYSFHCTIRFPLTLRFPTSCAMPIFIAATYSLKSPLQLYLLKKTHPLYLKSFFLLLSTTCVISFNDQGGKNALHLQLSSQGLIRMVYTGKKHFKTHTRARVHAHMHAHAHTCTHTCTHAHTHRPLKKDLDEIIVNVELIGVHVDILLCVFPVTPSNTYTYCLCYSVVV